MSWPSARHAIGNRLRHVAHQAGVEIGTGLQQNARRVKLGADANVGTFDHHIDIARGMVDFGEYAHRTGIGQLRAQIGQTLRTRCGGIPERDGASDVQPELVGQIAIGIMELDQRRRADGFENGLDLGGQAGDPLDCGRRIGAEGVGMVGRMFGQFICDEVQPDRDIARVHPGMRIEPVMGVVMPVVMGMTVVIIMRMAVIVLGMAVVIIMRVAMIVVGMPMVIVMRVAMVVVGMAVVIIMRVAMIVLGMAVVIIMRVAMIVVGMTVVIIMRMAVIVVGMPVVIIMRMAVIVVGMPVVFVMRVAVIVVGMTVVIIMRMAVIVVGMTVVIIMRVAMIVVGMAVVIIMRVAMIVVGMAVVIIMRMAVIVVGMAVVVIMRMAVIVVGMAVVIVMRVAVVVVGMAMVIVMRMAVVMRMPVRVILQMQPLGIDQRHHFATCAHTAECAGHPWGQFLTDPEHQIGLGERTRLSGAQLEGMWVATAVEQQIGRARLSQNHRHQRMGHPEIGHDFQIIGRERCSHHGTGQCYRVAHCILLV